MTRWPVDEGDGYDRAKAVCLAALERRARFLSAVRNKLQPARFVFAVGVSCPTPSSTARRAAVPVRPSVFFQRSRMTRFGRLLGEGT